MKHNYVPDGCFLLARQIFESAIWRDDPHVLKLFIYLMGQARHNTKPKKYPSFEVKRGELVTSLAKISEENEYSQNGTIKTWPRMKISRMLDLLEKQGYVKKLCDTYGTHISICNYNTYQDINNYKCDSGGTQVLQDCYSGVTGVLLNKNVKKGKNVKKEPSVGFEDFYKAYPKKKSKGQAEKTWHKLSPDSDLLKEILIGLESAKKSEDWTKDNGKYIPHPSTWLNAKGWEDEITESKDYEVIIDGVSTPMTETEYKQWKVDNER
jgi:hypothetical protein